MFSRLRRSVELRLKVGLIAVFSRDHVTQETVVSQRQTAYYKRNSGKHSFTRYFKSNEGIITSNRRRVLLRILRPYTEELLFLPVRTPQPAGRPDEWCRRSILLLIYGASGARGASGSGRASGQPSRAQRCIGSAGWLPASRLPPPPIDEAKSDAAERTFMSQRELHFSPTDVAPSYNHRRSVHVVVSEK
jgi:hypothetical protein